MKYSDAIAAVTGRWLERDPGTIVMGEEVANFGGGAYGATRDLPTRYPDRVINTPISEGGFCGIGLGLAMSGMRPIIEVMFPDFTLVAADQIFNQIGKARHMYGGTTDIPLVLRTRVASGCGYGGQHSMDPIGLYALFSGWRIVAPSDSADYIGLFNTAMHSLDPVLVLEHHSLYTEEFAVPEDERDYCIPFGKARLLNEGEDMTIATYGAMTRRVARLTPRLHDAGVTVDHLDLRSIDLASVDFEALGQSVAKTGVFAVVEEAAAGQSIGRRIASEVTERFFDELDAPPGCLASLDVPNSVSKVLEEAAIISDDQMYDELMRMGKRMWK
jgi:2-oxoisovalerate dehydrogenase E1 component